MELFAFPKTRYLRRVFLFTHLTGLVAGGLIPLVVAPLCGQDGTHLGFILACLAIGYLMGAASYVYVHQSLRRQLSDQIHTLGVLGRWDENQDQGTLESMLLAVQYSVASVEDLVKTILVTVDNILPHYQKMTDGIHYLAERARIGLNSGQSSREAVSGMSGKYREVLDQMHLLSERIQDEAALSRQLSASLEEMAEAVEHSSGKFLETTSAVDEMAASIREVATQSNEVGRMVEGTAQDLESIGETFEGIRREADGGVKASQAVKEDAERGLGAARNSVTEMEKIEEESRNASTAMERLAIQTGEVEMIIEVIRDLVSDTELLAFNAAIIAAQAGEEGKGFSVVAEEIRDLADRTASSAGEIHRTIQAIGSETRKVMGAVTATSKRIDEGKHTFESAEEALRKILASAKKSVDFNFEIARMTEREGGRARNQLEEAGRTLRSVQGITRAMKEQEEGILRIQDGVEEMKSATDRISRGMEEQVRATQAFDRGLEERDSQVRGVQQTMQYLLEVTDKVVAHFEDSIERLRGNVSKTSALSSEVRELEGLTGQLRKLVEGVNQQVAPDTGN